MPKGQKSLIHYFKSLIIALLLKVNSQKALLFEQVTKSQISEDDLKHEKAVNSVRANSTTTQIKFDHPLHV